MKGGDLEDVLSKATFMEHLQSLKFWRESPTTEEFEHIR